MTLPVGFPSYELAQTLWAQGKVDKMGYAEWLDKNHVRRHRPIDWKRDTSGNGVFFICLDVPAENGIKYGTHSFRNRRLREMMKGQYGVDWFTYELWAAYPRWMIRPESRVKWQDDYFLSEADIVKPPDKRPGKGKGAKRVTDFEPESILRFAKFLRETEELSESELSESDC